jgi:glutaredoxin-related protein
VHINEEENPLILYLKGTSMIPKLGLDSTFLDFSDQPVNSKK